MTDIHSPSAAFLRDVHNFVSETGMSESQLGRRAVGDSGSVARLRRGHSITLRTADRITAYMAAERALRLEAGARLATACQEGATLSEYVPADREAALERGRWPGPAGVARFLAWFPP